MQKQLTGRAGAEIGRKPDRKVEIGEHWFPATSADFTFRSLDKNAILLRVVVNSDVEFCFCRFLAAAIDVLDASNVRLFARIKIGERFCERESGGDFSRQNEATDAGRASRVVRADNDEMLPGTTLFSGVKEFVGLLTSLNTSSALLRNSSCRFDGDLLRLGCLSEGGETELNAEEEPDEKLVTSGDEVSFGDTMYEEFRLIRKDDPGLVAVTMG